MNPVLPAVHRTKCQRCRRHVVVSLLLFAASSVQAAQYCVSTSAELQDALNQAALNASGADNIELAAGTYATSDNGNAPFTYQSASTHTVFLTGYNSDCPGFSIGPRILDGGVQTAVLAIDSPGPVSLNLLTIQNGYIASGDSSGTYAAAGLSLDITATSGTIRVERCIFQNNVSDSAQSPDGGFQLRPGTGTLFIFDNNKVWGNHSTYAIGAGEIVQSDSTSAVFIVDNTVTGNTTDSANGIAGGLALSSNATNTLVHNNILHGNTKLGLVLYAQAHLYYNDIGTLGGPATPYPDSHDTVSLAPKFVDFANGDLHLSSASSLFGLGRAFGGVLGDLMDLDGHVYPYPGKVDLGAYQDTIFSDGFDGD